MGYYSVVKRKKVLTHATTLLNPKSIRKRGDALTPVIKPVDSEVRENQASVPRAWNQPQGGRVGNIGPFVQAL